MANLQTRYSMRIFLLFKWGFFLSLFSISVNAQILTLQGVELLTPIAGKTSIKIQMKEYTIGNKSILFKIKNTSENTLKKVYFILYVDGEQRGTEILRLSIPKNNILEDIRFDLPDEIKITEQTPIKLQALQDEKLLAEWNTYATLHTQDSLSWFYGLIAAILFTIGILYISLFFHPLIKNLSKDSSLLLQLPLQQLPLTKFLLQLTWRLQATLDANESYLDWLQNALLFLKKDTHWRCDYLIKRLNLKLKSNQHDCFEYSLGITFPLNLREITFYFPSATMSIFDIKDRLQYPDLEEKFVLIISLEQKQLAALHKLAKDRTNLWIVPNTRELTKILLSPEPVQAFVQILSKQLTISGISPYQTTGGIKNKSIFFGREQILTEILNKNLSNYLLLGGRQIGKSSLLKQIERWYEGHPTVECFYFSLSDHELLKPLARHFGFPKNIDIEILFEKLGTLQNNKRRLLLIDEADKFARVEMQAEYPVLSKFRSLSDEGKCFFILAGFWDLYEVALLDYQSPLRNFGKPVVVGELEEEACRLLATEPMKWLGISYQNDAIVDHLIKQTGQRANLIAVICDEILKHLEHRHLIEIKDIEAALQMPVIESALSGWTKLTHGEEVCRLDRIIVYGTALKEDFKITDLIELFELHHLNISSEQLNQSLSRLQLAFILREQQRQFRYCVPLFQKLLQTKNLKIMLNQELK